MGLDRNDQVIERRLAQKIAFFSRGLVAPKPPTNEVLADWYAENGARFQEPGTYTISQLFLDPDRRDDARGNAQSTLAQLQAIKNAPEHLARYGDNSILGRHYASRSEIELRKLFGSVFVDQVILMETGVWHGPVSSGYGFHLVYVHDVVKRRTPTLGEIQGKIQEAWMLEQVDERSALFIDELIGRYDVVIEETPIPMVLPPSRATPRAAPRATPRATPRVGE